MCKVGEVKKTNNSKKEGKRVVDKEGEEMVWKEIGRKHDNIPWQGGECDVQNKDLEQEKNWLFKIEGGDGEENSMEEYLKIVEQIEEGELRKGGGGLCF